MRAKNYNDLPSPRRAQVQRNQQQIPRRQVPAKKLKNQYQRNLNNQRSVSNANKQRNISKIQQQSQSRSKIPIKQKQKLQTDNANDISQTEKEEQQLKQSQKRLKEMLQMQLFADPASIEATRKNQKIFEEKIKRQIEEKRKEIGNNSLSFSQISNLSNNSGRLNNFAGLNSSGNYVKLMEQIKMQTFPQIREEPFVVDLGSDSIFDKSTVRTPLPGFSLRKRPEVNQNLDTLNEPPEQLQRLDTASEMIYPDGHRVPIKGQQRYPWPPSL